MAIDLRLSDPCQVQIGPDPVFDGEGRSNGWVNACPGGLGGIDATRTDVPMRYELTGGQGPAWRFVPSDSQYAIPAEPDRGEVFSSYTGLGFEHILFGLDRLLFVLGLLLSIQDVRTLIGAITAFTVAHSITLGAAALGWLNIPGPPVEAIIALSIVFLASEILHSNPDAPRLSETRPLDCVLWIWIDTRSRVWQRAERGRPAAVRNRHRAVGLGHRGRTRSIGPCPCSIGVLGGVGAHGTVLGRNVERPC